MKHGLWRHRWDEFQKHPVLKQRSLEDIALYGNIFLQHIEEPIDPGSTFSDGVPKEKLEPKNALMVASSCYLVHSKLEACGCDVAQFCIQDQLCVSTHNRLYANSEGRYRPVHDMLLLMARRRRRVLNGSWKHCRQP